MIRVQRADFDVAAEMASLSAEAPGAGAVCVFVGLVRDLSRGEPVAAMTLEHYPGMTERTLARLEAEARDRWPLAGVRIVHRHGRLDPGERIVLVAVASAHRDAAFDACRFLIDRLKTTAPFWKAEENPDGRRWVEARPEDDAAVERWGVEDSPKP
jgi:molybdopterin synthase catalytic subunit